MERRCSATGFTQDTHAQQRHVSIEGSRFKKVLQSEIYCRSSSHDQKHQIEVKDAHICTKAGGARRDLLFTRFSITKAKTIPLFSLTTPHPLRVMELLEAIPAVLGQRRG